MFRFRQQEPFPRPLARVELSAAGRRSYRRYAIFASLIGPLLAVYYAVRFSSPWWGVAVVMPFWAGALYEFRATKGWVRVEAAGLRTSNLLRGRFIGWQRLGPVSK